MVFFKGLGMTIISMFIINLISLLYYSIANNPIETFKFKHGLFLVNGNIVGLNYFELKYLLFLLAIFVTSIFIITRSFLSTLKFK